MEKTKSSPKAPEQGFESALKTLQETVRALESGQHPLEESLALFEKGVSLARVCQKELAEAEKRVELLLEKSAVPN